MLGFAVLGFVIAVATVRPAAQAPAAPAVTPAAPAVTAATSSTAVLKQYCATCHNERLKSGGLVIDPADVANVGAGADRWEKVVRKLRTQSMPPPGAPRPEPPATTALPRLETELDRAEAAVTLGAAADTRLSRTEYRNAVDCSAWSLPRGVSIGYPCRRNISGSFEHR